MLFPVIFFMAHGLARHDYNLWMAIEILRCISLKKSPQFFRLFLLDQIFVDKWQNLETFTKSKLLQEISCVTANFFPPPLFISHEFIHVLQDNNNIIILCISIATNQR